MAKEGLQLIEITSVKKSGQKLVEKGVFRITGKGGNLRDVGESIHVHRLDHREDIWVRLQIKVSH